MGLKGDLKNPKPALSADRLMAIKALFGQLLGLDQVPQKKTIRQKSGTMGFIL